MATATLVYSLCFAASALCAWLLVRSYLRQRTRLLVWSAACFILLAANNFFVVLDVLVLPDVDLSAARTGAALLGISLLLYGFIFERD
jgi:hypothetical protein